MRRKMFAPVPRQILIKVAASRRGMRRVCVLDSLDVGASAVRVAGSVAADVARGGVQKTLRPFKIEAAYEICTALAHTHPQAVRPRF